MRYDTETTRWRGSATDLANHARCTFLTHQVRARERAYATGELERPAPEQTLAMRHGIEHEARTVAELRAQVEAAGGRFLDLDTFGDDHAARRAALHDAMRDGIELIAQAPLRSGSIFGYADLLERTSTTPTDDEPPLAAGTVATAHRYRPVEVKFARTPRPEHLLQAAAYADALADLQGELPVTVDVICGDGTRHAHPPSEYVAYFTRARERFDSALQAPLEPELDRVPEPVPHCATCELHAACTDHWRAADHLSLVARIRADQRTKLVAAGITTLTELATTTLDAVPAIGRSTFAQLRAQARLQFAARTADLPPIEFRHPAPAEPGRRGFALLPEPDPHDTFFDFEGYPYHDSGGLEYLWGWAHHPGADTTAPPAFDFLWADSVAEEDSAFEAFLHDVETRRTASDGRMHVYHYAPYEITALRRIARRRPAWMDRLDALLVAGTFVDLYAVVRQALLIGTESYSIKRLEQFYARDLRAGAELADGGASIDEYEHYLVTRDPDVRQRIIDYNRDDCVSTIALRDWLLGQRDAAARAGITWPEPPAPTTGDDDLDDSSDSGDDPPAAVVLRDRLDALASDDRQPADVRACARLLAGMPGWGWRIKREFLAELHAGKHERSDDDFRLDPAAVGALELVETLDPPPRGRRGTIEHVYGFPEQVTLLRVEPGDPAPQAWDPHAALKVGTVTWVDPDRRRLAIRSSAAARAALGDRRARLGLPPDHLPTSLVPYTDFPYRMLEAAAADVARSLLDSIAAGRDPFAAGSPHAAALGVLARRPPRVIRGDGPERCDVSDPRAVADLAVRLDHAHLVVQGPPGTGKTWTSAHLIHELVARGMRVGISSNSHEAIVTVLEQLGELRDEHPTSDLRAAYAPKRPLDLGPWLTTPRANAAARDLVAAGDANVLAGTAWTFCDPDLRLDAVLVDEAGQVSLLAVTATAACTTRVLLVGDPQQLPQPSSTSHPHGCGASALEMQFGEHAVLPPDRALLLPVTRRMHPALTDFISSTYYDGRLTAHPSTSVQRVVVATRPELPAAGPHLLEVPHAGRSIESPEEVAAIAALVGDLLASGRVVARPSEPERAFTPADIVVVAPYNAQRRALQEALGDEIRVGTVDKFQGKEAAVAIVSMTASSRDDLPRGLEFLLDPHRLNVAISRARALAVVVTSPALLATDAASLREMRLLNDLARLADRRP